LFATADQLSGEVEYAFTLFLSSVEFIRNFSLHVEDDLECKDKSALISTSDLVRLNDSCTSDKNNNEKLKRISCWNTNTGGNKETKYISVSDVREARLLGEVTNISWANRWMKRKENVSPKKTLQNEVILSQFESSISHPQTSSTLPYKFVRPYTYISTHPSDIRVGDIPLLLKEYQEIIYWLEIILSKHSSG